MNNAQKLSVLLAAMAGMTLCFPHFARAEHAAINLTVVASGNQAEAQADEEPPLGGREKVPVLHVKTNEPLVMQFILTNLYPHKVLRDVTVLYYVVRIDKLRQKPTPDLKQLKGDAIVMQGRVLMNFKPKCRVGARLKFRIPKPGIYRVRVETLNTQSDHEHFSAIDLKAQ